MSDYILIENNQLYPNFVNSLEFDMTKGPTDFVFLIAVLRLFQQEKSNPLQNILSRLSQKIFLINKVIQCQNYTSIIREQ